MTFDFETSEALRTAVVAIGLVVQAEEDVALQLRLDDCQILPRRWSTSM